MSVVFRDRPILRQERIPFVGRSGELASLRTFFAYGERFVTVVGPSGVGKTRLALQFARLEAEADPSRVIFVDLSEARTDADLAERILPALGLRTDDARDPVRLGDGLRSLGDFLLVLDNCESLQPDARQLLDRALERAPLARLLVTSLLPLGIEGELRFELPPLDREHAVALYESEARRSDPGAALDRVALEELVDRLDRNALAIRLAAARTRTLPPRQLLARLDQRFELLRGGPPGRHESLQRAIAHSWETLAPCEAIALAQCAVFSGSFTLEAAEGVLDFSVCPRAAAGAPPIVEVIDQLRSKALLGTNGDDPPRFTMLESIRAYALAQLDAAGGAEAAWRRHAAFFLALGEPAEPFCAPTALLQKLEKEEENLRVALRRTAAFDGVTSARLALVLQPLFAVGGRGGGTPQLEAAVESLRTAGDPALLCRALVALATAQTDQGDLQGARGNVEEALALARSCGSPLLECAGTVELGAILVRGSGAEQAVPLLTRCVELARAHRNDYLEARAEGFLGLASQALGRPADAIGRFERAVLLQKRNGCHREQALALLNLGACYAARGEIEQTSAVLETARELASTLADRVVEASVRSHQANIAFTGGHFDEAERHLTEARRLLRESGKPRLEANVAGNLAVVALQQGRLRLARDLINETLPTMRTFYEPRTLGVFTMVHGAIFAAAGEIERARVEMEAARTILSAANLTEFLRTLEVFEGLVDVASARATDPPDASLLAAARRRLAEGAAGKPGGPRRIALHLLEQALAGPAREERTPTQAAPNELRVGPDGSWFELAGTQRVRLGRRHTIRRVLCALVENRLAGPGPGLTADQVFEAGWPGERALPHAAAARVYDAIRVLRSAGLEAVLLRNEDGYLLDPDRPVRWAAR